jgi:predicted DNA-binding protein
MSKVISIRIDKEQEIVLEKFANSEGKSISQFVRDTIFEKIEDEMDIQLFNERVNSGRRQKELSKDLDEVIAELGL